MKTQTFRQAVGLIMGVVCHGVILSQSIVPASVNSAGVGLIQDNASMSFTIGETVIQYFVDSVGNTLCGGVIPSSQCDVEVTTIQNNNAPFDVRVFPIPSTAFLTIDARKMGAKLVMIEVVDLTGSMVYQEMHRGISSHIRIETHRWPTGVYILRISDMNRTRFSQFNVVKQ